MKMIQKIKRRNNLRKLYQNNYVFNDLTSKQIDELNQKASKLYHTIRYKHYWKYQDKVKELYAPISQAVKQHISSQPRYSTHKTITIMQKLIKDIKNNLKTITRNQLVKIFYIAKYSNLHTDYPESLGTLKDPVEINDGDDGVFNSFNESGQRLTVSPLLGGNPKINAKHEQYNIKHRNDPNLIFPSAFIDNLHDVIDNIKFKEDQAKIYNQSKHIITTESNVKDAKSIKSVSTDFNKRQEPLDFKIGILKEKAVESHVNALINIRIKYDEHFDDILGPSGKIYADLANVEK